MCAASSENRMPRLGVIIIIYGNVVPEIRSVITAKRNRVKCFLDESKWAALGVTLATRLKCVFASKVVKREPVGGRIEEKRIIGERETRGVYESAPEMALRPAGAGRIWPYKRKHRRVTRARNRRRAHLFCHAGRRRGAALDGMSSRLSAALVAAECNEMCSETGRARNVIIAVAWPIEEGSYFSGQASESVKRRLVLLAKSINIVLTCSIFRISPVPARKKLPLNLCRNSSYV